MYTNETQQLVAFHGTTHTSKTRRDSLNSSVLTSYTHQLDMKLAMHASYLNVIEFHVTRYCDVVHISDVLSFENIQHNK